jgi:putative membrane protein
MAGNDDAARADRHQAAKAQVKLARSAGALRESADIQTESADRRTVLAANRTVLAAERTYAAWVRTGLAALASGIGARALLEAVLDDWLIMATGSLLIVFSAFCFMAAVWREMSPGAPPPVPDTRAIPPAILIGINGFLVLVSFAALVGLWSSHR